MKKLLTFLGLIPTLLFAQTPTMRQVALAGTAITRLPAASTATVSGTDTIMIFRNGAWIKTRISAIGSGSFVPVFPALADQVLRTNGTGGMKSNGMSYIDDSGNMTLSGDVTIVDDSKKLYFGLLPALRVTEGGSILNVGDGSIRNIEMSNLVGIGTGTAVPSAKLHVVGGVIINNVDVSSSGVTQIVGLNTNTNNSTTSGVTSTSTIGHSVFTTTNSGENGVAGGFIGINSRMIASASQTGTLPDAKAINIATPSYSASPIKPTTNIGLSVSNQGITGVTSSYGILVNAQLNATTNYGIACQALLNGFGTSTPTEVLEVQGNVKIVDGTQGASKVFTSNATGVGSWQTPSAASVSAWGLPGNALTGTEHSPTEFFGSTNNFDVIFKENNSEFMRIRDGKLGIGNPAPDQMLHLGGIDPSDGVGFIRLSESTSANSADIYIAADDGFLIINPANYVGIGATVPAARLQINGTGATPATYGLQVHNSTGTNNALVIQDDGWVGIGTNSPASSEKLQIGGLTYSPYHFHLGNNIGAFETHTALEIKEVNSTSTAGTVSVRGLSVQANNNTTTGVTSTTTRGIDVTTIASSAEAIAANGLMGMNISVLGIIGQSGILTDAIGLNIGAASYTGGSLDPSTIYGVKINNQGNSGTLVSHALNISAQTGSTTNYGITVGGGNNGFGTETPTAIVHSIGSGTTTATFSLKAVNSGGTNGLYVNDGGQIYGTSIHNNANAVTGTTNQYIASGTYTPTITNTTNVAASTPRQCQYMRVGNVVTVSGVIDVDITTTLLESEVQLTLPIASDITLLQNIGGSGSIDDATRSVSVRLLGDTTTDRVRFSWSNQASIGSELCAFSFTYLIQ